MQPWERTDLVVRTVFKIAEVVARRLVGSIPTRSRHLLDSTLFYAGLRGDGVFATPFTTQNPWALGGPNGPIEVVVEQLRCRPALLVHDMGVDVCRYVNPGVPEQLARRLQWDAGGECQ